MRKEREGDVSLAHATQLLQEMLGESPITSDQVWAFRRNPGGPILPESCVSVTRLEDAFGPHEWPLAAIAADRNGTLWSIREKEHAIEIFRGRERLYAFSVMDSDSWSSMAHFLGFVSDGQPVIEVWFDAHNSLDVGLEPPTRYFVGDEMLPDAEDVGTTTWTCGLSIQTDGSLLYAVTERVWSPPPGGNPQETCTIMRRGCDGTTEVLVKEAPPADFLVAGPGGDILSVERHGDCAAHLIHGGSLQRLQFFSWFRSEATVWTEDGLWCIDAKGVVTERDLAHEGGATGEGLDSKHGFVSRFTRLPDGRFAFIGKTRRHERAAWIVDGQEQPAFGEAWGGREQITDLFQRDGRWRYYGITGRFLCLMELPAKK